jgi:hypothetical protein
LKRVAAYERSDNFIKILTSVVTMNPNSTTTMGKIMSLYMFQYKHENQRCLVLITYGFNSDLLLIYFGFKLSKLSLCLTEV